MSLKYVFKSDESDLAKDPLASGEVITEGEFVIRTSAGEIRQFDPANDALPDGIIVHHVGPLSDVLVEHDEDYVSYEELYTFRGDDGDSAYYLPLTANQKIMPETVADTSLPEPSISDGVTVGIVTIGSSGETRIVEEGYEYDVDGDGTAEVFSESGAGDFVPIGNVSHEPQYKLLENNYDQRVSVHLDQTTFSA